MVKLDLISYFDRIIDKWEKPIGLFFSLLLFISFYYISLSFIDSKLNLNAPYIIYAYIPLIAIIFLVIFWFYSTNRIFLKFSDKIVVGLVLQMDEGENKLLISKIVKKVIREVNNSKAFENIKIKILPSNILVTDKEAEKYHNNFSFMYDVIVRIFVDSGKFDSIEKIKIDKQSITFRPNSNQRNRRIYFHTIDMVKDMGLFVSSRDWEYSLSNSGIDNKKYFENIHHVLLYYIAFYAMYVDRYEDALVLLKSVYTPEKTKIKIEEKKGDQVTLELKPINISEGRISAILVDLFFYSAIKSFFKSETEKALKYFEELSTIVTDHPNKYYQLISMARFTYELGDLHKAKIYTNQAKNIHPNLIEIYLNLGFFAILDDSIGEFVKNYWLIYRNRSNQNLNWVDILSFQESERSKKPEREKYFKFSTSFISYLFVDGSLDRFKETFNMFKDDGKYDEFYKLGRKVLNPKSETIKERLKNK